MMRTRFNVNDPTIHRIIEQEDGFTPVLEFLPGLSRELLEGELLVDGTGGARPAN